MHSSVSEEHYTPHWLLDMVIAVLGKIDIDPCADPRKHVPAKRHFTAEDDGLLMPWFGTVFMNSPYGEATKRWTRRMAGEYARKRMTAGISLTAARTDTQFFRPLHKVPVCYVEGRIRFLDPDFYREQDPAPFPSALSYFGPDPDKFARVFSTIGDVQVPYNWRSE